MSAPTASGPDMSMHLAAGQAPQGVGGAGVAQLREQRRVHQLGDQRAVAERREARLGAADDRAVACGDRAQARLVAVDHRGDGDVDRLGREHQAGAAEAADLEVEPAAAVALPRIIERGRSPNRTGRGCGQKRSSTSSGMPPSWAWTSGAEPLRPETVALPPAKLMLVGASAQPSPGAGQHRRLVEHQRLALDPAAAGQPDGVGRDTSARVEKAKAAPRRPAKAARTWPAPLTSLALAVSRASVDRAASRCRARRRCRRAWSCRRRG